jgi:anti-repressor protein
MNLIPFQFESASIRVVEIDGEPWFVAGDVARALGYADPTTAVRSHCRGVQKLHPIVDALKRRQDVRVLTEGDVMRLIVGSTLAGAERFERWVFDEVLPEVRRKGTYGVRAPQTMAEALQLALDTIRDNEKLSAQVAEQAPKVAALELISEAYGAMSMRDTAKQLQMRPSELIDWLKRKHWIFKAHADGPWIAYQQQIDRGLMVQKIGVYGPDGERIGSQAKVTPKGIAELARKITMERLTA